MLKKYFYKTALTTAALSTAVSVLLAGCGQSAGTGTAKTNTVTSAVSGQTDIRSSSNSDSGSTADSAGTSGADSSSAATSYIITDEEIAAAYANTDNSYDAMYLSRQPGNPAGTYETVHYYSTTAGTTRQACVMLPTEYDPSKDYPVVYLLHGLGGNDEAWKDMGADCIAENLHIYQNVPQMILVGVDSVILSEGSASDLDMWGQLAAYDASVDDIVNDLMPYINTHYPVRTGRENTAIAGYSMGGRNALYAGFSHPELFGYVGAFSPAAGVVRAVESPLGTLMEDFTLNEAYGQFPMLLLTVGYDDGICKNSTEEYDRILTEKSIDHIFYETEGGHDGDVWQKGMYNFMKRLFYGSAFH